MLTQAVGTDALLHQTELNTSTLSAAVKKLLMCKEEPVKIATVQCVVCLITGHRAQLCADTLLGDDVAGMLVPHWAMGQGSIDTMSDDPHHMEKLPIGSSLWLLVGFLGGRGRGVNLVLTLQPPPLHLKMKNEVLIENLIELSYYGGDILNPNPIYLLTGRLSGDEEFLLLSSM